MSYYKLTIIRDTNFRDGKLSKAITKYKLTHQTTVEAEEAAAILSQIGDVDRVIITLIHESPQSVWRKGKKS